MHPETALQNEVCHLYLVLIIGLLGMAGIALLILGPGLKKDVSSVWITYRSWLVMAALFMGCIFAGRAVTIVALTLVSMLGFKEFARATGLYLDWWMTGAVYIGILAIGLSSMMSDPGNSQAGWYGLFTALPVLMVALLVLIPVVRNRVKGQLQHTALAIMGFIYIGWMFGHLGFLTNTSNAYGYLLYLVFAVEVNDVSAFIFGKLFGKHPLRSQVSPSKTWEGSVGGLAVSMALPWLLRSSFPQFTTLHLLVTGLIVGVGGQLGDLSVSVIKRDLGVKDMGTAIPGHGGILDRIDSLIYVAPLFLHSVNYAYKLW